MFIIFGLGNPGKEYKNTRHNTGRLALEYFAKKENLGGFEEDKDLFAKTLLSKLKKEKVFAVLPEAFINNSGKTVKALIRKKILRNSAKKDFSKVIVLHDDLDIPFGRFKISYGRNPAGHKGVESIKRVLKTNNFLRIRIGIAPKRKISHKKIVDFLIGKFAPLEKRKLNFIFRKIAEALNIIIFNDYQKAMSLYN